jgi:hypothetical protein
LPFARLFLREVYAGCAGDLGRIGQAEKTNYAESRTPTSLWIMRKTAPLGIVRGSA